MAANISPKLEVTRFADTKPGSLLVVETSEHSLVGLAVEYPKTQEKHVVLLGSASQKPPDRFDVTAYRHDQPVLSFSEFTLRLSHTAENWMFNLPKDGRWLVLCGGKPYILANILYPGTKFVYIDFQTGLILCDTSGNFAPPGGPSARTLHWSLWTKEDQPREILSFS
jgi:hypothetical protein